MNIMMLTFSLPGACCKSKLSNKLSRPLHCIVYCINTCAAELFYSFFYSFVLELLAQFSFPKDENIYFKKNIMMLSFHYLAYVLQSITVIQHTLYVESMLGY